MNYHDQHRFEADAMRVLSKFHPKVNGMNRFGAPVCAVPLGFSSSSSGCPVRRYRDPRTGRVLVYGVDRASYARGLICIRQLA